VSAKQLSKGPALLLRIERDGSITASPIAIDAVDAERVDRLLARLLPALDQFSAEQEAAA
jgi:hypothetical protein